MLPEKVCVSGSDPCVATNSSPCNSMCSCIVPELKSLGSHFKVKVTLKGRNRHASVAAMVDCGATALFISQEFVRTHRVRTYRLRRQVPLYNIDGSPNRAGGITHFARLLLQVRDFENRYNFLVTNLGPEDVVLGLPWLRSVNPEIDWKRGALNMGREGRGCEGEGGASRSVKRVASNRAQR